MKNMASNGDWGALWDLNRGALSPEAAGRISALEHAWITSLLEEASAEAASVDSVESLESWICEQVEDERSSFERQVLTVDRVTRAHYEIVLREVAPHGLTECEGYWNIIPRLPFEAQMPIIRSLLDEFGCGNPKRAHATLYRTQLADARMATELSGYLSECSAAAWQFVLLPYWMTVRAPGPGYFLGYFCQMETVGTFGARYFSRVCRSLAMSSVYWDEHVHIDGQFHGKEALRAVRTALRAGVCEPKSVQVGFSMGRTTAARLGQAIELRQRAVEPGLEAQ